MISQRVRTYVDVDLCAVGARSVVPDWPVEDVGERIVETEEIGQLQALILTLTTVQVNQQ